MRRQVSWVIGPEGLIAAISAPTNNIFPTGTIAIESGLTLVRTRGELLVYLVTAGGANIEGFRWAFGMCIVTENAAGIGVTAVPGPITDIAWDGWFVYETGQVATQGGTLDQGSLTSAVRIPIDSKAMRKFKESDVVLGVLEVFEQGADSVMAAHLSSRMLVKLS